MKNLRKLFSLVLILAMTVTTSNFVFAEEQVLTSGEILQTLGLITGDDQGNLMEDKTITRAEVAQIIVKIMNWELEPFTSYDFADESPTWAIQQIATLKAKGITKGVGNNEFGANLKMDALQTYAWIYAAVTGDTTSAWSNPSLLQAILSNNEVLEVIASKGKDAKRSEIFNGMVTILKAELEDGKTQLDKLIEAGVVKENTAIEVGLKELPKPVENVIVSAELLNLKEAKIVFTLEASENKEDYKFDNKEVLNVTLSADKKEATVLLKDSLTQQQKTTFTYKNDKYEFEKKDLSFIDSTIPTVLDVQTTDKTKLTVIFSEPINPETSNINVKVNNGMLYATVGSIEKDGKTVVVNVSSIVDGNKYDLEITGAKDYAGYAMAPRVIKDYAYNSIKAPVTVSVKEANTKQVILSLSAATVKKDDIDILDTNFSYILNKNPQVTLSEDKKELILDLTGYQAPEGTWVLTIKDADKMFEDSWGNKAQPEIKLSFTVVVDKVAPTVSIKDFKQADEKLTILFDKSVNAEAKNYSNYYILNAEGKVISNAFKTGTAITTKDNKEFVLAVNKNAFTSETVTLVIAKDKIADTMENKLVETRINLDTKYMQDLTATVKAIKHSDDATKTNKLYITYSNNMLASTTDIAKWAISAGKIEKVQFEDSTKEISITLKEPVAIENLKVETLAITDVDGNSLLGSTLSYEFAPLKLTDTVSSVAEIAAFATEYQTVQIQILGKIVNGLTVSAFELDLDGTGPETKVATVSVIKDVKTKEIDNKTYTVITVGIPATHTLNADAKINALVDVMNGEDLTIKVKGLVLNNGVKLDEKVVTVSDKIAPTVNGKLTASVASKTATIALTEEVFGDVAYFSSELVVKYDGKVLVAGLDYTVTVGTDLKVTLTDTYIQKLVDSQTPLVKDKEINISLPKTSNYVKDINENALTSFEQVAKFE